MKEPPRNNTILPPEAFPLVKGEKDELAAYEAYLSVPALLEYRAKHQGDRPFLYDVLGLGKEGPVQFRELTFKQVWDCVQVAASELGRSLPPRKEGEPQRIVAMIGRSGMGYMINDWALELLGHAPVLASLTNTPSAIASLMKASGATDIVYHPDQLGLAEETAKLHSAVLVPWSAIPDDISSPGVSLRSELDAKETSMSYACVHHSSGSTGNPKPLPCRHRAWLSQSVQLCQPGVIITPLNHIYPRMMLHSGLAHGTPSWIFPHAFPLSPKNIVRVMEAALPAAKAVYLVTSLLGPLLDHIPLLRQYHWIMSAGAPPTPSIATRLVDNGVNFTQIHGMSECGFIMSSIRDFEHDKDWSHVRAADFCKDWVEFRPVEDGLYQMIILSGAPHLNTSNCEDGSLDTKDLWRPHPTKPGYWEYVSRTDEIIVHSNGLKTDPWPIEHRLGSAVGIVKDSMVVGANHTQPAVLISLAKPYHEVKDKIWALLEEANQEIPTFSRIVPELIIPFENDDFVRSTKRSIIRPKSTAKFQDMIDEAYAAYEGIGTNGKALESEQDAVETVLKVLEEVFPVYLKGDRDQDFFALGMNSITATRLRNSLQTAVKLDNPLEQNVAFAYNTANSLARHLWNATNSIYSNGISQANERQRLLDEAIASLRVPNHMSNEHAEEGKLVLMTGSTGGLGTHMLEQLCRAGKTKDVLCPVRADSFKHARQRIAASLADRKLPSLEDLDSRRLHVHCFHSTIKHYPPQYANPSVVYHLAWPVNFNYTLSSFAPSIQSTVDWINKFPHAHHVIASSGIVGYPHAVNGIVPEEIVPPPPDSIKLAYGTSKWIAEKIGQHAATLGVKCTIVRINQITGDTEHGVWTPEEAPPIMVRTAAVLGFMPDREIVGHRVNWTPMDSVAWAVANLPSPNGLSSRCEVVNILSEKWMDWGVLLDEMRDFGINFEAISYEEWVRRMKEESAKGKNFPAERLLKYFEDGSSRPIQPESSQDNLRRLLLETLQERMGEAEAQEEIHERLEGCDAQLVRKMLETWRARGLV